MRDRTRPFRRSVEILQTEGTMSLTHSLLRSSGVWNAVTSRYPVGTNVFDRDWDLLILLDACRVDALRSIAPSTEAVNDVGSMWSVGSMTAEWILQTFDQSRATTIADTAVIAGNGWYENLLRRRYHHPETEKDKYDSDSNVQKYNKIYNGWPAWDIVSADDLAHFEPVPVDPDVDDRIYPDSAAHTPALTTDRAIAVARQRSFDRMIVHYVLPHTPFVADAVAWDPGEQSISELMSGLEPRRPLEPEEQGFDLARQGELSRERVHKKHIRNVRLAMEYVGILLENVDAETAIISSDHGEAIGEYGIYGHPYGFFLPPVKTVPWVPTTATDERTYNPAYNVQDQLEEPDRILHFLEDMGYV